MPRVAQVVGARDEVGEGVRLVLELAVVVPGPAHLGAAAHVGDGEDPAPLEEREAQHREPRVARYAVGAVAVQQPGRGAVGATSRAVHDRDRHPGAVRRGRPLAALAVLREVVAVRGPAAALSSVKVRERTS